MASSAEPTLTYWERQPPLAGVALAKHANVPLKHEADPKATKETVPTLKFPTGEELVGVPMVLRYLARLGVGAGKPDVYGAGPLAACQVDQWLDFSSQVVPGQGFEAVCASIDKYLALRTFLAGYAPTAADFAVWGALQACPLWKKVKGGGGAPHLSRWFDCMAALPECAGAAADLDPRAVAAKAKAAAADAGGVAKGGGDTGSFDVGLPNAVQGAVVTRFPPEPSGFLHIGHAKAALLNQYFAKMYGGKLLVRFDDTNPSKEKDEFVENIIKDTKDLGLEWAKTTYTSDYFPQARGGGAMIDLAKRMIKAGILYADDTPVEQMREERMHGIESKRRNRPAAETAKIFEDMIAGTEDGLKHCIRYKMDMQNNNKALRDPVCFRCNMTHHWRTGHEYKVWRAGLAHPGLVYPTYDFACPFTDAMEGVTHALRTSEYKDREEQYYRILKGQQASWPGLPDVTIWDYSRLNFVNTILSKRKLTWFVETGRVDGWDDPRMPTVQGILRRGLKVEALREFILGQGASKNATWQEWDKIWTINKRIIDPVCPRHTALDEDGLVPLTLEGGPAAPERSQVPRHKKHPPAGSKTLVKASRVLLDQADAAAVAEGEEVTLMDWGNAVVTSITKDADGKVTAMAGRVHPEGDPKKTKLKLTWLADVRPELTPLQLLDFDFLISKKKVEEDDNFEDLVNEITKYEITALGDLNMRDLARGDVLQLERRGYYIVDKPWAEGGRAVLLMIPDGRARAAPVGRPVPQGPVTSAEVRR
ncbi:MAG: tRNA synthetases class I, catalytic domain-containing protein [Monoraphidium minutum]|nr:MAG: tRNA synthetases class I, catalytic domain-containing protein [Monoraphidium minutum]